MAKAKMALTHEQYMSLCAEAKDLHDYWREWNRKLYEEAAMDGSLYNLVATKGQAMQDEIDELEIDGIFGKATEDAVSAFQRASLLEVTGEVDLETYNRLSRAFIGISLN